ncbi:fimbrial protein [Variovorax boronicumulans]|uniref:fimbrial protein n=1 Tax=Variovorax boronicumulans TaxID=436515 RepID=UPI0036F300F7
MKKTLFKTLLLAASLVPFEALAQCSMTMDVAPLVAVIGNIGRSKINPNVPDGTVIDYVISEYAGVQGGTKVICSGGLGISPRNGIGATGPYNTYRTSIPGGGLRFSHSGSSLPANMVGPWPLSVNYGTQGSISIYGYPYSAKIEIVKIGEIKAGGTLSGEVAAGYFKGTFKYISYVIKPAAQMQLAIPTCKVTTPSVGAFLGNVSATSFTGVGQTSQAVPLNISLTCSNGAAGVNGKVFVTLTDQTRPTNVSNTLSLNAASTAQGVGIQVLNGTNVISYGPDSNVVGNKNQWLAGTTSNGVFNIPLTARYVQTDTTVKPGSANGRATFTMSYQ